jgi:hypothetical protein
LPSIRKPIFFFNRTRHVCRSCPRSKSGSLAVLGHFHIIEWPTGLRLGDAKNLAPVADAQWWIVDNGAMFCEQVMSSFPTAPGKSMLPILFVSSRGTSSWSSIGYLAIQFLEKFRLAKPTFFLFLMDFFDLTTMCEDVHVLDQKIRLDK